MSSVITIDATELNTAAPRVTAMHLRLVDAATRLVRLDLGVEMPPGVRGRVAAYLDSARGDLVGAADGIDGMGADIARRAGLAELADALGVLARPAGPAAEQLKMMADYSRNAARTAALNGNLSGAKANRAFQMRFDKYARRLGLAGKLVAVVPGSVSDLKNPYTSGERKAGEVTSRVATTAALGTATKLAVGALGEQTLAATAMGGPIGLGIGLAWTFADYKFHLNDKIADGATWTYHQAGEGLKVAKEGVDKVTPWDGAVPW